MSASGAALVTGRNLADPDAAYDLLIAAHAELDAEQSAALNARLLLTLVNHIGDAQVLAEAIAVCRPEKTPGDEPD